MKKPCFAVMGDVNPGKSSVVAALTQDTSTGVSPMPGETTQARRFTYRGIFDVWDTPGFDRPLKLLREVEAARAHSDPLSVFRDFVERNRANPEFDMERELLKPILEEGAALIYVVDPSRVFSKLHEAETEILKITARPLLVVFNATQTPDPENARRWSNHIKQHFGQAPIEFNAHRVTAGERAGLIREFAAKCAGWGESYHDWTQPLRDAAKAIEDDFDHDLNNAVSILVELLERSLSYRAEGFAPAGAAPETRKKEKERLAEAYKREICRIESASHRKLIENFGHERMMESEAGVPDFFAEGLFDAETAQVLGLSLGTLTITATAAGAAGGGMLDLAVGGASFATGAVLGGLLAGGSAYLAGKVVLDPNVREEGEDRLGRGFRAVFGTRLSTGTRLIAGPVKSDNFPFVLLDRAIGLIAELLRRTHARRDQQRLTAAELKASLDREQASTDRWPKELRSVCLTLARRFRDGKAEGEYGQRFREGLRAQLKGILER